jgi:hypothetical protein
MPEEQRPDRLIGDMQMRSGGTVGSVDLDDPGGIVGCS